MDQGKASPVEMFKNAVSECFAGNNATIQERITSMRALIPHVDRDVARKLDALAYEIELISSTSLGLGEENVTLEEEKSIEILRKRMAAILRHEVNV